MHPEPLKPALDRIFEVLGEGVWQRDLRTGQAWYSPRLKAMLGHGPDIADDAAVMSRLIHPEDLPAFDQTYREAAARPGTAAEVEARVRDAQGRYRWFRARVMMRPGPDGRPSEVVGAVSDIDREKQQLAALAAMTQRFERAIEASSEAHLERTAGVDDFFVSDNLCRILGHPPGTPAPTREQYLAWVHPDDLPGLAESIAQAWAGPGAWQHDYRMRTHDGGWRWVRGRGRSERDAEGRVRMTGMIGDIHEQVVARQELLQHRRQLEAMVEQRTASLEAALAEAERLRRQAERASEAKSQFLGHMSHELRTPLSGVLGLNELAQRLATDEEQRRYLDLAHRSGQTLLRIVDDVLDFAKADAGKLTLHDEPFDLAELLAETFRSFIPLAAPPVLSLFDIDGEATRLVGDAARVRQIVTNLVGNAMKFTAAGHVALVARTRPQPAGRCEVRLEVRDTGIGMDAETAQRVFAPFEQADGSVSRRHGGTGLGLSIVQMLARMMGGDVEVESERGRGSVFRVRLMLGLADEQPRIDWPAPARAWLVYRNATGAEWGAGRVRRHGWQAEVLPRLEALLARLAGGEPAPEAVLLGEESLVADSAIAMLHRLLPPSTALTFVVRPQFELPLPARGRLPRGARILAAPLSPADLAAALAPPTASPPLPASVAPRTTRQLAGEVLIVEDNPLNQLIASQMLEALGLTHRIAESGEQAIVACLETPPALALMDVQMPGMDGLAATRMLRAMQQSGRLPAFPIVGLSAHALAEDREASLAAGMDAHLTKPIDLALLGETLRRWLPAAAR